MYFYAFYLIYYIVNSIMKIVTFIVFLLISNFSFSQKETRLEKAQQNAIASKLTFVGSVVVLAGANTLPEDERDNLYVIGGAIFLTSVTLDLIAWNHVAKSKSVTSLKIGGKGITLAYNF